ncbi:MAG: hypothetical protein ACJAVF_004083, partial [Paraglaciecola sp.]
MHKNYFSSLLLGFSIFFSSTLSAQCPDIQSASLTSSACMNGSTVCNVCEGDAITLNATGENLPDGGTLDWYYSTTPNFNPYNGEGTYLGSADISTPTPAPCSSCPFFLGHLIDACVNPEADNEYMVVWSGNGFDVNNFQVDFDANNNVNSPNDDDINLGQGCSWVTPPSGLVNCPSAVLAGPGTNIPQNALVVIFPSAGATATYDFSVLCSFGLPLYVMMNSCDRDTEAFSNGDASGNRTTSVSLIGCNCSDGLTYDTDNSSIDPPTGGDFVVKDPLFGFIIYFNSGCGIPGSIPNPGNDAAISSIVDPFDFTTTEMMCNGGPYYAIGILNPAPPSPSCPQEMTEALGFNVICPEANPTSIDICLPSNGQAFVDLTLLEPIINSNSGNLVNWFHDANGLIPVPLAHTNVQIDLADPNFYASTTIGNCISDLVPITVNLVPPTPPDNFTFQLSPTSSCGATPVTLTFFYNEPEPITVFYELNGIPASQSVFNGVPIPFGNTNASLTVTVTGTLIGNCDYQFPAPETQTFAFQAIPTATSTTLEECADLSGMTSFNLAAAEAEISSSSSEPITWYSDMGNTVISSPDNYIINNSTSVFVQVGTPPCTSVLTEIFLAILTLPQAMDGSLEACGDEMNNATFDLTTLDNPINNSNGNAVIYLNTQDENDVIVMPNNYASSGNTVYAVVSDGQCISDFVTITLTVNPLLSPNLGTANICDSGTLFDLSTIEDPTIPDGIWIGAGVQPGSDNFDPTGLSGTISLIFIPSTLCSTVATTQVTIGTAQTPNLGTATICESDGFFDLSALEDPNFMDGNWSGMGVQADGINFDPTGQNGPVTLTFTPTDNCVEATTTQLTVTSASRPVLSTTDLCENNGIYDLTPLQDMNSPNGTWTGTGVQLDGINFDPTGLTGEIVLTFTPNGNCSTPANTTITVNQTSVNNINEAHCPGYTLDVNGTIFSGNFPVGTVVILNGNYQQCDSTINVNLTFNQTSENTINQNFCSNSGNFVTVNGLVFDENNSTGSTTIIGGNYLGCDSTITVNLNYESPQNGTYTNVLCTGDSQTIGGVLFNEANPSGNVVLQNVNGCDSTVNVTLTFNSEVTNNLQQTFCSGSGDELTVNGQLFNENNPTGSTTIINGSYLGCDSTINISLTYESPQNGTYTNTLCTGGSESIGGTIFDENTPSGTVILQSFNGCDSTVMVSLIFNTEVTNNIQNTFCSGSGQSITTNGIVFNEANPSGTTTITGGSYLGCDSSINVNLTFPPSATGSYTNTLCQDEFEIINGTLFDEFNPTGTIIFAGNNGCDSIVTIQLNFINNTTSTITNAYCSGSGEFVNINGQIFNENNPNGIVIINNGNYLGCDSTITINLSFENPATGNYTNTLCPGGFENIGGIIFDENNPNGAAI